MKCDLKHYPSMKLLCREIDLSRYWNDFQLIFESCSHAWVKYLDIFDVSSKKISTKCTHYKTNSFKSAPHIRYETLAPWKDSNLKKITTGYMSIVESVQNSFIQFILLINI